MPIEYFDIFKKQKPTPSKESCSLCDPEKSKDKGRNFCCDCKQTLPRINSYQWGRILDISINKNFPEWFIATSSCNERHGEHQKCRHDDSRHITGGKHFPDRNLGNECVDNHGDSRRNDRGYCRRGRRYSGTECPTVTPGFHFRHQDLALHCRICIG